VRVLSNMGFSLSMLEMKKVQIASLVNLISRPGLI
jgi:hypothetical protein